MNNFQKLIIERIVSINPHVNEYTLVPADHGQVLEPFVSGQFIDLAYQIGDSTCTRPYSIASSPLDAQNGFYQVYIYGFGYTSSWLFENAKEGDIIYGSKPIGDFIYNFNVDKGQLIGIAGGMSVTPLHSIAKAIAQGTIDCSMTLFTCWDSTEDMLFYSDFIEYSKQSSNFNFVYVIKDSLEAKSIPYSEAGYISLDIIQKHSGAINLHDAQYLVCGPKEMYNLLGRELAPLKIPSENYMTEIPGEIKTPTTFNSYPGKKAEVFYNINVFHGCCSGGEEADIKASNLETIEVALERAGMGFNARCRSGVCGYCLSILEEGTLFVPEEWDKRDEGEKANGKFHPCCSFPLSDLKIIIG